MGLCSSIDQPNARDVYRADERRRNHEVNDFLKKAKQSENKEIKCLLLGAGGSGKSTVFKQLTGIYGKGYSNEELKARTPLVHNNVIQAIQNLIIQAQDWFESGEIVHSIPKDMHVDCERLLDLESTGFYDRINEELASKIKRMWNCQAIQICFARRHEFNLQESARYFIEKIDEIAKPDYVASVEDHLRVRVPTTGECVTYVKIKCSQKYLWIGLVQQSFSILGNDFTIMDVGGQRSERKKWIHCMDNVTCVIFVAFLSGYNEFLYEDYKSNRIVEALNLFEEIVNCEWFINSSFVLFLNKLDIFKEKIASHPITECPRFSKYGGNVKDFEATTNFIRSKFEKLNKSDNKTVACHITCATNKKMISVVFDTVKDHILKEAINVAMPGMLM